MFKKAQHFKRSSPLFIVEFRELLETLRDDRKFHTVIINRLLYGDTTYWMPENNSRPMGFIRNATGLKARHWQLCKKWYWHHIVSFQMWKPESKIYTACLPFCSTNMLIVSPQELSSALRHGFQLVGLLSESALHRDHCCLLVLSGSEKRWFGTSKDMNKGSLLVARTTFVWTIIRYVEEKGQKLSRWHNQSSICAVPANLMVWIQWNLISVRRSVLPSVTSFLGVGTSYSEEA